VPPISNRPQYEPDNFAPDSRPGADTFVYCKGCGTQLESRARLSKPRAVVDTMMCEACVEKHGHPLMPSPGSQSYCYRCGGPEKTFTEPGTTTPVIHHICPRCLPERAARYTKGDFETPLKQQPPVQAEA
jgi:hypothetical protein